MMNRTFELAGDAVRTVALCALVLEPLSAARAQSSGLSEEVIVTAQRRAQNLQEVPVAVTAVTAETLEAARVENIGDVQQISPKCPHALHVPFIQSVSGREHSVSPVQPVGQQWSI